MKSTPPDQLFIIIIQRSERSTPVTFITDRSLWKDRYRVECSIQAKYRSQFKGETTIDVIKYRGRDALKSKDFPRKTIRSLIIINSLKNATN